ncbi:uncharacterized protein LOC128996826 [Macrosteles quadrilineatus]|uniref:uncharacterized protein LOC128996826 n=1 Tax=Macrosteles quadrilineatus TaxID=74068 RepID=UPI0023E30D47|nr:uncharacterized protein LOC128996826 [Macrosteles quadrilineatus]
MYLSLKTIFKMRKYHQLLLFVITIISLSTLLVYRREYLKLRYVLEVLNYFGSPQGGGEDCLLLNDTYMQKERNKYLFSQPKPSWTKVQQHFVYSSFWENEGEKLHVRALAVGPPSAFINFECHIWFDQGDYLSSVMGKFGYSLINVPKFYNESKEQHPVNIYELFCEPVETLSKGLPYGWVLIYKRDTTQTKTFLPIFKTEISDQSRLGKVAACVRADISGASKSTIVEFISYHQAVGVTDFITYDNGLQYKILSVLQTLSGTKGFSESLSILNWNFPFSDLDVEATVLEMDCIARTSGQVETVVVLNWDEYIVPKLHHSIKEMLQEATPSKKIPVQFEFESFICCTDLKDDRRAEKNWPVALRKTQLMSIKVKRQLVVEYPVVGIEPSNYKMPSSTGAVHIYRPCRLSGLKTITKYDPIMARFLGSMITSTLIKLWKSGSLLNESQKM